MTKTLKRTLITVLIILTVFSAFFLFFNLNHFSAEAASEADLCITSNDSGGMYWQRKAEGNDYQFNVQRTERQPFITDIENSSAVVKRTYSFKLDVKQYSDITYSLNNLVIAYGRRDLMDAIYEATWHKFPSGNGEFYMPVYKNVV